MSKQHDDDRDDEEDDYESPRRRKQKDSAGSSVLRFVSPGTFLIAGVLFFLPWTDLSCRGPMINTQIAVQSGLQSATGEYSEGSGIADLRKQKGMAEKDEKLKLSDMKGEGGGGGKGKSEEPEKAPILWLYFGLLIAGAIVPVTVGAARMRGVATMAFAGFAAAVLIVQLAIGMPFANFAKEQNRQIEKELNEMKQDGGNINMFGDTKPEFRCNYLPSFWITFVVLAGGAGLGLLQVVMGAAVAEKPSPKRRHRRDDVDELEDD